jgi:hypothetical protein
MYTRAAWCGTPHIGTASSRPLSRVVSVRSSSRAPSTASSKNIS